MIKKLTAVLLLACITVLCLSVCPYAAEDFALVEYSGTTPALTNITSATPASASVLKAVEADGVPAVKLCKNDNVNLSKILVNIRNRYMCELKNGEGVDITVKYFDEGNGSFVIAYDSRTDSAKETEILWLGNTGEWKTHTFHLYDAYFTNRYLNADFALSLYSGRTGMSESDLILKSIDVRPTGKSFPIDLSESGTAGNMFEKGDIPEIRLSANNITADAVTAGYRADVTNSYGETCETVSGSVTLDAGMNEIVIPMKDTACGVYDAKITFYDDAGLYGEYHTNYSISVSSSVVNEDMGMNTHYRMDGRNPDISLPMIKRLGAAWIRDEFTWRMCETEKGVVKVPEVLMNYVDSANKNGIKVLGLLNGGSKFYDDGKFPTSDEALKAYANYIYTVVSELKGKVDTFQIWNEFHHTANNQNLTVADYVKLVKVAYEQIMAANPECTIVGFSGAPSNWAKVGAGVWQSRGVIRGMFEAGVADYMDVLSIHEYDLKWNPEYRMVGWIDWTEDCMKSYNAENTPLWVTETGWSTAFVSDMNQAAYGVRQYIMYKNAGVDKYFWYDFKNDGFKRKDQENSFGIIYNSADTDNTPYSAKPAYVAFSNMNDKIGNANIEEFSQTAGGTQIYRFAREDGKKVWVLWNAEGTETANINVGESEIEVFDIFGNMKRMSGDSGEYGIEVSGEPVYIMKKGYDMTTGITEINYRTGDITVNVGGLNPLTPATIMVLRPGMTSDDVYEKKFDAVCHLEEITGAGGSYEFTFTADAEGVYNIYVNTGTKMLKIGAAFYMPLGARISVWQGGVRINEFSELKNNVPVTVKADVDNTYGVEDDYMFICGLYRGGSLVSTASGSGRLSETADGIELTVSTDELYDGIKVFLWRDKTRLIPITDNVLPLE